MIKTALCRLSYSFFLLAITGLPCHSQEVVEVGSAYTTGNVRGCPGGLNGGTAGLTGGSQHCATGGGQSFCSTAKSYTYECAGVEILPPATGVDIDWP